jgi:hypothetical protein
VNLLYCILTITQILQHSEPLTSAGKATQASAFRTALSLLNFGQTCEYTNTKLLPKTKYRICRLRLEMPSKTSRSKERVRRRIRRLHKHGMGCLVTAQEFLNVFTELFNDMRMWIAEVSKDDALSASDLAMLNASMKIVERVTLIEANAKPDTAN